MYFNAGAARIPSTHRNLLAYCKELEIDLEVFINENKTSYLQDPALLDGKPIRNIDYTTHTRGFLAELLAKSLSAGEMDQPFTDPEAETLISLIIIGVHKVHVLNPALLNVDDREPDAGEYMDCDEQNDRHHHDLQINLDVLRQI